MKKLIFLIIVILVVGYLAQNYTSFKVFDYAKNYWHQINWSALKNFKLPSLYAPTVTPIPGKQLNIFIRATGFVPNDSGLEVGGKVTWFNEDSQSHNISGDGWSSGELKSDQAFSKTFETAGIYKYHCSTHPSEIGKITVQ